MSALEQSDVCEVSVARLTECTPAVVEQLAGNLKDAGWQRENMSQNRLAILPDRTHYDMFLAPELVPTVLPFLNGERKLQDWADQGQSADGEVP